MGKVGLRLPAVGVVVTPEVVPVAVLFIELPSDKSLDGETRVVMESTGNYHVPVAWLLQDAGLYVSVVNALLVHDYGTVSYTHLDVYKRQRYLYALSKTAELF